MSYNVNCLRWRSFTVFVDRLVAVTSEIACANRLLAMQDCHPAMNVFQQIKFIFPTTKLFHLKQFALYGEQAGWEINK